MKIYNVIFIGKDISGTFYGAYHICADERNKIDFILNEQSQEESFTLVEIDEVDVIETKSTRAGILKRFGRVYFPE